MLEISNLTFNYPSQKTPVVNDISLSFNQGNVYGLLGPNGAGKSTLLYLACGLLTPTRGNVTLDGINTRKRLPQTLQEIFIVPEEFALPAVSLKKYVDLYAKFYPRFSYEALLRNLETFELDANIFLGGLSMGQKKKAFMSFALATNTKLLILDEPTNGLDINGKASFRRFISSNMSDDRAAIISTHQVHDVEMLLDHVIIMGRNTILLDRSMEEISQRLSFGITNDPQEAQKALFAQPSIQGTEIIEKNTTGEESQVNLETLFQLVTSRPADIYQIFNS